jgi:hypothetical protein
MEKQTKEKKKEIHAHLYLFILFGFIILIPVILLVTFFISSTESSESPLEVLDLSFQEENGRTIIVQTLKMHVPVRLKECIFQIDSKDQEVMLSYRSVPKSSFISSGNAKTAVLINDSYEYLLPANMQITTIPQRFMDLDRDGLDDAVYICSLHNNCPNSLDGKALALNISGEKRIQYLLLENEDGSSIDLRRKEQRINTGKLFGKDGLYGITITGKKSEFPYALGINSEEIILYKSSKRLDVDLDMDGYNERFILTKEYLFLFITTSEKPLIIKISNSSKYVVNINDYIHYNVYFSDNEMQIEPIYTEMYFTIDPLIINSSHDNSAGDVLRIYSPLPYFLKYNEVIRTKIICDDFEHEIRKIIKYREGT